MTNKKPHKKYEAHPSEKNIDAKPILIKLSTGEEIIAVCHIDDLFKGEAVVGGIVEGIPTDEPASGFIELKMPCIVTQLTEEHERGNKHISVVKYSLKPWLHLSNNMYVNIHCAYIVGYAAPNENLVEKFNDLLPRVQLWYSDPEHASNVYGVKEFDTLKDAEDFVDNNPDEDIESNGDDSYDDGEDYDIEWDI